MKLGRIGPWPKPEVPCGSFGLLATRGPSLFSNPTPKMAVYETIKGHKRMKLGIISPGP